MFGNRFSSSRSCSKWRHETKPGRLDQSRSCRFLKVATHPQGRVENTFFRDTSIIGDGLRARSPAGQGSEAVLGCAILNRMTALGRPVSYRIGT